MLRQTTAGSSGRKYRKATDECAAVKKEMDQYGRDAEVKLEPKPGDDWEGKRYGGEVRGDRQLW